MYTNSGRRKIRAGKNISMTRRRYESDRGNI